MKSLEDKKERILELFPKWKGKTVTKAKGQICDVIRASNSLMELYDGEPQHATSAIELGVQIGEAYEVKVLLSTMDESDTIGEK